MKEDDAAILIIIIIIIIIIILIAVRIFNNNNNNNNNYEYVVRKFHTYMFKCALQLKYIKNKRYTLKVKITA